MTRGMCKKIMVTFTTLLTSQQGPKDLESGMPNSINTVELTIFMEMCNRSNREGSPEGGKMSKGQR